MARYTGPVCRLCRREGEKLFLKGERCFTSKCAIERREGAPGQHGKARQSRSDFKMQLRAKQKAKRTYGVLERQFRGYFHKASHMRGVTGTDLLGLLETRLDNVCYRLGFGASRQQARQFVTHGHLLVNGKRVNIPSYRVSVGDIVDVCEKSKTNVSLQASIENAASRMVPGWLTLDKASARGTVNALPTREVMPQNITEQLIVELYSK
jgi:small subunit ribosomal protein S4